MDHFPVQSCWYVALRHHLFGCYVTVFTFTVVLVTQDDTSLVSLVA